MDQQSKDPKRQAGDQKCPLHLLPTVALRETAYVLKLGADKYGVYNWRTSDGVRASTYCAAILRHLLQFMDGEDADTESGRSHLAHIMATCSILLDADRVGKLIDDRAKKPIQGITGTAVWLDEAAEVRLNETAEKALRDAFAKIKFPN